ncbi:hypothetical protein EYC80_007896 [Monilinia laxa]|uniref:Telomeric single stranded DNA binding POT1/Cdc13 domain-containing protein n=1 Tax=Monilinia laxa TaxID=61186 RepID=A0A5N6JSV4_MONLA|nr:hypothetical protein EYC80_007896 [Monilinia laxa]
MAEAMAETIAAAEPNGIPDSITMSTLESTTHIPIAQLTPSLPASASRSVKAVVTLTWPYSSRTGSVAFLLAEPDFRLRRTRGQVRVQFSGSAANIIAKSGIASGDEVVLCLDGVEYIEVEAPNATPGRGVEFELKFTERLLLQFRPEESQHVKFINIDHPDPEPVPTPASVPAAEIETESQIPEIPATPVSSSHRVTAQNAEEYVSPVFLKRERTSYGSMFAEGYDPFEVEDGSVRGKGRKRTRLSTSWRFTSRSPSTSPEAEEPITSPLENSTEEPSNKHAPAMTDEGVQTMEVGIEATTEETQELDQRQPETIEETAANGVIQVLPAEAQLREEPHVEEATANIMPPPQKQSDIFIPENEQPGTSPNDTAENLPSSPQLRPLPSEGLPLVSPLVASRFEMFNNHIHSENAQDLEVPNVTAATSVEADLKRKDNDKDEDLYGASPQHRISDQLNSDQTSHQTSIIPSGNAYGSSNLETIFTSHQEGQFEAEQGAEQFLSPYNTSGPNSYTSADAYAGMPGDQDQYVPLGMEEGMSQYSYPDPEQIHPQSNSWGTQGSMAYPDLEDVHQQSASHSPYPQLQSMPPLARTQSHQSHQSHQSQAVDLTESDEEDEDAEGFSEVEDNRQEQVPALHSTVGDNGETFSDEEREYESSIHGDENNAEYNNPPDVPEENDYRDDYNENYEDDYSGDDDEDMNSRDRSGYFEDELGYENDYDEDNYSDDEMNNHAPPQQQPQRAPEVIDLLSSDDEDEEPAAVTQAPKPDLETMIPRIENDLEDNERNEDEDGDEEEETEDDEDEDVVEDEDDEGEGEGECEIDGEKGLDVGDAESQDAGIPTTKPQEFIRESSESIEDEPVEAESKVAKDSGETIKTEAKTPKIVSNEFGLDLRTKTDVNPSSDALKDTKIMQHQQEISEEEDATESIPEPMDFETILVNASTTSDKVDVKNTTDNLDGLFEKLEEAGSENRLDQDHSSIDSEEPQNDKKDLENEDAVQISDEANTDETPSQKSEPSQTEDKLSAEEDIPHDSIPAGDNENAIISALGNSPSIPKDVEVPGGSEISSSDKERMMKQVAKSGWSDSPKKAPLFSKVFGLDGADDASDEGDKDSEAQVSYPTSPVAEVEDQQEFADGSEQILQIQNSTQSTETTKNHLNDQLLASDDTQKMNIDEDSFTSISDLVQFQLQEEMGEEMDEDLEIVQTEERVEKDLSTELIEDEDQNSAQEEINEDEDEETAMEDIDRDDFESIDPVLKDFEVEITKTEITEVQTTESTETEVEQVQEDLVMGEAAEEEQLKDGESEVEQIEASFREAEMIELETQQTLVELADSKIFRQNTEMVKVEEDNFLQTIEETEATIDKTKAIILEQIRGAPPSSSAASLKENHKGTSPGSKKSRKEVASVSPRQTRSSKEPSPELKKSKKAQTTVGPRQTRSKKLEPLVELVTPITPTKPDQENERSSTRGSNRSKRSPSLILDEEEAPQGHDASAEMVLDSLGLPESPTKAGHHLRSPACSDPKLRLTKYLRTDLSEYTTLKMLRFKISSKLDILAIATSVPPDPQRAKSGPRHYTITFTITDQTIAPSGVVEVKIFRPYKDALPTPEIGDGILLRDFSVSSIKGKGFALRSEEGSSWAVFKDEGTEIEVRGPPVEYGPGEKKHMKELREWFHGLDENQKIKLEKVRTAMEKGSPGNSIPEKKK